MLIRYWPRALIAVCLLAIAWVIGSGLYQWGYDTRDASAQGEIAKLKVKHAIEYADKADEALRETNRRTEAVGEAATAYERGKKDAEKASAGVVSGLLADKRRLHHEIGALHTERLSRDSTAPGELSAEAQRGAARLGAVVRVVAEQDAQIRGLQQAYEALRRPAP